MAFHNRGSRVRGGASLILLAGLTAVGCPSEDEEMDNVLPTASASGSGDDGGGTTMVDPTDPTDPTGMVDGTGTGGGASFPVTYRFDCINIRIIGDGDGDGEADGTAFQGQVLQNAWSADIAGHKLNILLTVSERDEAAGTAALLIGSGVGTSDSDLCMEATTAVTTPYAAGYEAGAGVWGSADAMTCSAPDTSPSGGTYSFALTPNDVIYVYAEDDDGTTFNCNPTGAFPDAVPVRAIEATVTVPPDGGVGYGELTGCLTAAEAGQLCSCLGECVGDAPGAGCEGCPNGANPLASLLGGIDPSNRCSDLMGEDAFDLTIGFSTSEIPIVPEVCG